MKTADYENDSIRYAAENGFFTIVKLLMEDKRVNPSASYNWSIKQAFENKHYDVVKYLWKLNEIKETLKENGKELYSQLISEDIKNKVKVF